MNQQQSKPKGKESPAQSKAKQEALRMPFLFRILLIMMLVLSFVFFATKLMEYNRLKQATADLEEEIQKHESNIDELKYLIDSPVDDEYIIRIAREKLGLVFPDEEIFYHDFAPKK